MFINDDPDNFMAPLTIRRPFQPEYTNFSNLRTTGHKEFEMFPDLNPDYSSQHFKRVKRKLFAQQKEEAMKLRIMENP